MKSYFTIKELIRSHTADMLGINNAPSVVEEGNLMKLIDNLLNPIRERWGMPIYVNSGYRCPALNKAIGGVKNSQHLRGEAADITAGSRSLNRELFKIIAYEGDFNFDQLIDEKGYKWIHISYKNEGENRNEVLHL